MSKRRRSSGGRRIAEAKFWGEPVDGGTEPDGDGSGAAGTAPASPGGTGPSPSTAVRPTPDPGALVRSLGPVPLAVDPTVAERHLTAVYEEAVKTASALAAASGVLATDSDEDA